MPKQWPDHSIQMKYKWDDDGQHGFARICIWMSILALKCCDNIVVRTCGYVSNDADPSEGFGEIVPNEWDLLVLSCTCITTRILSRCCAMD